MCISDDSLQSLSAPTSSLFRRFYRREMARHGAWCNTDSPSLIQTFLITRCKAFMLFNAVFDCNHRGELSSNNARVLHCRLGIRNEASRKSSRDTGGAATTRRQSNTQGGHRRSSPVQSPVAESLVPTPGSCRKPLSSLLYSLRPLSSLPKIRCGLRSATSNMVYAKSELAHANQLRV